MSDDQGKLLDELGDLDWDSALDEWEKNTFVPEVARDAETNKVAPAVEGAEELPRVAARPASRAPAAGASQGSLKNVSSEGTVIAPVPRELRAEPRRVPSAAPPLVAPPPRASLSPAATTAPGAARGGLGQLFAKGTSQRPPAPTPPPRLTAERTRTVARDVTAQMPDDATGERPAVSSRKLPSVTRQMSMPASFPPEAYAGPDAPPPPGDQGPSIGDAPTVSTRDVAKAAAYDSNETVVAERTKLESMSDADTETHHPGDPERSPADDEAPTFMRSSPSRPIPSALPASAAAPTTDRERPPAPEGPAEFAGEQPATRWLDGTTTTAFRQRAAWLEEEARAIVDQTEQARALLGVSELLALVGDDLDALALATEARDLAPAIALAWRQARQLMPRDTAFDTRVESFDAEAAHSPTPAARVHAVLMAADVLRANGDGDAAVARWATASKLDPADVRAPAARAALALAQNNHSGAGNDLAENSELVSLDRALAIALKLRGAPRPATDVTTVPINDALRRARNALLASDVVAAAQSIADVAAEPALAKAALWLSAALGATHIAGRRGAAKALRTLGNEGEPLAPRQLAARGIELGDPELVSAALDAKSDDALLAPQERATLLALAGQDVSSALDALDRIEYAPLVDALSTLSSPEGEQAAIARSRLASGRENHRSLGALGRLLASLPSASTLDFAVAAVSAPRGPAAAGVALEVAVTTKRWDEVSSALSSLPLSGDTHDNAAHRHVAAALVAERAGNREHAKQAWREALTQGAAQDSVVRVLSGLDTEVDLAAELLRIAEDLPDGPASAILRLEALARRNARAALAEGSPPLPLDDDEQLAILERVHRGAPALGIGAFLAERIGRRKGDVDEVVRWIQERRSYANDTLETALDAVREALLVADRDPGLASTRLEEAHRARPDDVALRELYERLASEPLTDRGAWREKRAEKAAGPTRALLFTEAAIEHELAGDYPAALRTALQARDAGDVGLSRPAAERAPRSRPRRRNVRPPPSWRSRRTRTAPTCAARRTSASPISTATAAKTPRRR